MPLLYHLGIILYSALLKLLSLLGHRKAAYWVNGRKNWRIRIQQKFTGGSSTVWFHCASLGEYELSVPLLEQIKKQHPEKKILVTFFSPSGYEIKKDDPIAFHMDYLPIDSARNAYDFISMVRPEMVFFAKYDFWYHYLSVLHQRQIPTYVFSATFRPSQVFFKSYGKWYLRLLSFFTHLYVTNETSADLLKKHGIRNVTVTGDNRYDRVFSTAKTTHPYPLIEAFKKGHRLVIAGSTWPEDENVLCDYINNHCTKELKFIFAPHEIGEHHIQQLEDKLQVSVLRYSQLTLESAPHIQVIIIDNIGMLSSLYRYGDIAYVGGAFKQGLHNILEPLSFGLPVLFGPEYKKYPEAYDFISCGGAFSIHDSDQLKDTIEHLLNNRILEDIQNKNITEVSRHVGATEKIIQTVSWITR